VQQIVSEIADGQAHLLVLQQLSDCGIDKLPAVPGLYERVDTRIVQGEIGDKLPYDSKLLRS
jgi:hypothetical protein